MEHMIWFSEDEAANAATLEVTVVRLYAELGLIEPSAHGYDAAGMAELRRVRRMCDDLDLDHDAVAVLLRMRRRMLALQSEVRRLEAELRSARVRRSLDEWIDAEWE